MDPAQSNPLSPQSFRISAQVIETQPQLRSFQFEVIVLRAHNLPRSKSLFGKERRFYVTVSDGANFWKTRFVRSKRQRVEWNENVGAFTLQPLSSVIVSLYAKNTMREDILIGRQEIACEPQREFSIILSSADVHDGHPVEPATLFLTITVSANATPSLPAPVNTSSPATADADNQTVEGVTRNPTFQANNETTQPTMVTAPLPPLSRMGDAAIESSISVGLGAGGQAEMPRIVLRRTEEALNAMETWSIAVDVVKRVMDAVGPIAALQPYANLAWSLLSMIPQTMLQQVERDDNVRTLFEAICDAFDFAKEGDILRRIDPTSLQAKILEDMLERVSEIGKFIESYATNVRVGKRILKNIRGQVDGKIAHYRTILIRLRDDFLARAAVTTEVTVLRMQDDLRELREISLEAELGAIIRELPYKGGWRFGDEKRCLPGTRQDFLDYIIKWIENPESERGLALLGRAGTGKSSIAHEVAHRFKNKCLGSYFTFLRKEGSKEDAYQLFTTLARDLSDRYPPFKLALGRIVKDNSFLRGTRDYRTLFELLLLEPLKSLKLTSPILVIIDAVDESGDAMGKNGLHTFLAHHLLDLPSKFRILVTSRPEDGIEAAFMEALSVDTIYMDDPILASRTEQDIRVYLEEVLDPDMFNDYGIKLAEAAEGMFQWAAVASGFINSPDSLGISKKECVRRLLGPSRGRIGQGLLDNLYEEVLKQYFKSREAQMLFRSVMGQLFAAIEPLSICSLITLRQYLPIEDPEYSDPVLVLDILRHLGSLLSHVTSSDETRPIVPLHTSFRDFLTSMKSDIFYVDLADAHHQLVHSCLGLMLDNLRFNICELQSSYLANTAVPDLESRIAKYFPPALSYSCVFWDDHLEQVAFENGLFIKLRSLVGEKFLFWLEVLSIKSSVGLALPALSSLKNFLCDHGKPSDKAVENLLALIHDASAFVRYFGMAVAKSAPHIYISALSFTPTSSPILTHYAHLFPRTLSLERGQLTHWPALEMVIQAHDAAIHQVAFSPNGQRVASASRDRTIRVWDATTGELVAGPFIGHTGEVSSVSFSPDGQRVASASEDHTIRVWDATTGEVVAGPFNGHTGLVTSVVYSPDGQLVASGSVDRTIRVWDATTGDVIAGPFTGHWDWVNSVAFSPDGRRIASASSDCTIRVWDATTGDIVAGPFAGHTGWAQCVAFSPDGQRIASASNDNTVCVWHAATGEIAVQFTAHMASVTSVAFSSDGQRIASSSEDSTIFLWDAASGEILADPLDKHTNAVLSVTFSPDGQRVASSSLDRTIRLWDTTRGNYLEGTSTGHALDVNSVAFSPDGQRIASASRDRTIRVWDAGTGMAMAGPFTGHTSDVLSVAFSPDGQYLASGSGDCTIRVWDAATGEALMRPLTGHGLEVFSVAFPPNGQHIASGSIDCTIRIWDVATGKVVVGPLTGHSDRVFSIAFSPVGQHIASASADRTVRIWDVITGDLIAGPFTRHIDYVFSVAFSPDGQRIASASRDRTICILDATTGDLIVGPFTGHTEGVLSVAFSPDGQRIASASGDRTIRVWDATTGEAIAGPFTGHTEDVFSVAFSPDGQRIASASGDGTICMWHATTSKVEASPCTEQIESIDSVGSSLDIVSAPRDRTVRVEKVRTEDIEKTRFLDKFLINNDGWMCGEEGELLLWIPQIHRPYLQRTNIVWVVGKHYTQLDLSRFVHGSNWAAVYVHS